MSQISVDQWIGELRKEHGFNARFDSGQDAGHYISSIPLERRAETHQYWQRQNGKSIAEILDLEIRKNISEIEDILEMHGLSAAFKSTALFSFPTFETSAIVGFYKNIERVALFHEGLLHSLCALSFWYARTAELSANIEFDERLKTMDIIGPYLAGTMSGLPYPRPNDTIPKTDTGIDTARSIAEMAIRFIICHELAHVALTHPDYTDNDHQNHELEFAADDLAFKICLDSALKNSKSNNYHARFTIFAPFLSLGLLVLISPDQTSTHPAPIERMRRLEISLPKYIQHSKFGKFPGADGIRSLLTEPDYSNLHQRISHHANLMSHYSNGFNGLVRELREKGSTWHFPELFDIR